MIGTIDVDKEFNDFSTKHKVTPVDTNGKVVKGVKLEKNYIIANITLLTEKTVPIKLNLSEGTRIR